MIVEKYICDVTGEEVSKGDSVLISTGKQLDPVTSRTENGNAYMQLSHKGAIEMLKQALILLTNDQQIRLFKSLTRYGIRSDT